MKTLLVGLSLFVAACGPFHYRANMPRPPVCVVGGMKPLEASLDDYGATYTPGMNGPAPAAPETRLVPEREAGAECVAPPWWVPPE
jgi:hypothetical protein